ncbi:hypothetical protein CYLTODRAFT_459763 [Cylindrobasidium torrendii FP15055 ss-10]|uniref:Uncharacterized protein n=1 Tax=Cylindrobasidium torrendii FP15055 ss-10 TaxID=1314674 RepID=A0A0D7ATL3_9AGAR|nr:hypothetical protein CYLTODRAFT_459763 [Cylindrobasidium torrendii FP15055 ss-10]
MSDPSEPSEDYHSDCGSDSDNTFHSPAASVDSVDVLLADVRYDEAYRRARLTRDIATQTEAIATAPQPAVPPGDNTVYQVGAAGSVSDWSTAAAAQHQGQHAVASTTRHKPRNNRDRTTAHTVVVVGRPPGVYPSAEAREHYSRVSGAIYQGYPDRRSAVLAWDAAQAQGLVGTVDGQQPLSPRFRPMNLASTRASPPSAMAAPGDERRFYCVYRGIEPGLYDSALESGLARGGVRQEVHESFGQYTIARDKLIRAIIKQEVQNVGL